tara:strand:- start:768 stop:1277 length:510 start_codon:yes stop_codon:yes gene_type:complete
MFFQRNKCFHTIQMNAEKNTRMIEGSGCPMCGMGHMEGGKFQPFKSLKKDAKKIKKTANRVARDAGGDKVTQFAIKKVLPAAAGAAAGAAVAGATGNPYAGMVAGAAAGELTSKQAAKLAKKAKGKGLMAGAGKKSSPWISHVKAYAKEHGIKYGEALKKASATYKGKN